MNLDHEGEEREKDEGRKEEIFKTTGRDNTRTMRKMETGRNRGELRS